MGDSGLILGQEDPLEKEMATHFSILAWRISWTEESGGLQFEVKVVQSCPTLCDPMEWIVAHQAPLSMDFSRQEY